MREFVKSIRITLILWLLTAIAYPLLIGAIALPFFPSQAQGSLIKNSANQIIGSELIGQAFTTDKYFWSRPSVINYSSFAEKDRDPNNLGQKTGLSGASNLAPSNPALLDRIKPEIDRLKQAQIKPTADLVYTSGSGLDPHISMEAARAQIERIAKNRNVDTNQLEMLITQHTEGRFLEVFGEPRVNVLKLNLSLDR